MTIATEGAPEEVRIRVVDGVEASSMLPWRALVGAAACCARAALE